MNSPVSSRYKLGAGLGVVVLTVALALVGCGGGAEGGSGGTAGGAGMAGGKGGTAGPVSSQPQEANYRPCGRQAKAGEFSLTLKTQGQTSFTTFQGAVKDGVDPLEALSEIETAGPCRLLNRIIRQCSPVCGGDTPFCNADAKCVRYPVQKSVGVVSVAGVNQGFVATPSAKNSYSNDGTIMYPGVTEGGDVTLTSEGGDYPALSLAVKGIAPLEVTGVTPVVKKGSPLSLSWKPPTVATGARIHVVLSLDNHGSTPQQIECDAPDTGSFDIPSKLVDSLTSLGLSGFPSATIARRSVESKSIAPGCVEFNIRAEAVLSVEVDGLKSCATDEDCPSGQKCQQNRTCK